MIQTHSNQLGDFFISELIQLFFCLAFPPLASPSSNSIGTKRHKYNDFDSASSNRNSQYSTLENGSEKYDDDEEEEDEIEFDTNIAYQYGNGFKKLTPKKTPHENIGINSSESRKNRVPQRKNPIYPDSYLTPPANDQISNFPFSRYSNRQRQRTPTIKRKQFDQSIAESDLKISHVTVFPPKTFSPSEKPRKITPPIASTIDSKSVNIRLPNAQKTDVTRINYNYHPIIDFFEEEEPKRIGIDRKSGKVVAEDTNWRPIG